MMIVMKLDTPHIWWMRFRLLAIALLVIVAILSLSYDRAGGCPAVTNSIVAQTCVATATCEQPAVPRGATLVLCGTLLIALGVNQRLS